MSAQDRPSPLLATRLALRPKEAALALGISVRTLRGLLPHLPHLREGNVVLIPVDGLRDWLRERARAECSQADDIAAEIVRALHE